MIILSFVTYATKHYLPLVAGIKRSITNEHYQPFPTIGRFFPPQVECSDRAGMVWGFAQLSTRSDPLMSVVAAEVVKKIQNFKHQETFRSRHWQLWEGMMVVNDGGNGGFWWSTVMTRSCCKIKVLVGIYPWIRMKLVNGT